MSSIVRERSILPDPSRQSIESPALTADTPQACTTEFTAALIRRDMGSALALLTDDVVFFYSNGTAILGKDAFGAIMTASWERVENYTYATLDSCWITQSDAVAAVIYSFAWSGLVGGAEVNGSGRGTRVFTRAPGAGWLVAHEHLSNGQWTP
jgi:ketosteroid isomerase-like protein